MNVYRVYDTLNSEYWHSNKGKTIWPLAGSAKNAWNITSASITFNHPAQTRFIIHKFELVRSLEEVK